MKNMLNVMVQEYLAICAYLQNHQAKINKGYIVVPREELGKLLDKNNYMASRDKLHYWKEMKWIDADEAQTTRKVMLDGKRVRVVKIDFNLFQSMRLLQDMCVGA